MSELKRVTILFPEEELTRVKLLAGDVPLSTWIRKRLLEIGERHESSDHQNVSGVRDVPVPGPGARAEAGIARPSTERKVARGRAARKSSSSSTTCSNPVGPGLFCPSCGKTH